MAELLFLVGARRGPKGDNSKSLCCKSSSSGSHFAFDETNSVMPSTLNMKINTWIIKLIGYECFGSETRNYSATFWGHKWSIQYRFQVLWRFYHDNLIVPTDDDVIWPLWLELRQFSAVFFCRTTFCRSPAAVNYRYVYCLFQSLFTRRRFSTSVIMFRNLFAFFFQLEKSLLLTEGR